MGKAVDFVCRGADGIVSAIPFNCMPGIAFRASPRPAPMLWRHSPHSTMMIADSGREPPGQLPCPGEGAGGTHR